MSAAQAILDRVPTIDEVRDRLRAVDAERRTLRRLLVLAREAHEARQRRAVTAPPVAQEAAESV